jgi:hypothetical protein
VDRRVRKQKYACVHMRLKGRDKGYTRQERKEGKGGSGGQAGGAYR